MEKDKQEYGKITNRVESAIDEIFTDLADSFDLSSGDFSPDQQIRLDKASDEIVKLVCEWKDQNESEKIQIERKMLRRGFHKEMTGDSTI